MYDNTNSLSAGNELVKIVSENLTQAKQLALQNAGLSALREFQQGYLNTLNQLIQQPTSSNGTGSEMTATHEHPIPTGMVDDSWMICPTCLCDPRSKHSCYCDKGYVKNGKSRVRQRITQFRRSQGMFHSLESLSVVTMNVCDVICP